MKYKAPSQIAKCLCGGVKIKIFEIRISRKNGRWDYNRRVEEE